LLPHNGVTIQKQHQVAQPATGGIDAPGINASAPNIPRHPATIGQATAQTHTNILGGAVRIIRLQ
jgi:hypothetical protein